METKEFYPSARWARSGMSPPPFVRRRRLRRRRRHTQPFAYYTNMVQQIEFIIHANIKPLPAIFFVKVIGQRSRLKIQKNIVNAIT